jgi:hypothetical protein
MDICEPHRNTSCYTSSTVSSTAQLYRNLSDSCLSIHRRGNVFTESSPRNESTCHSIHPILPAQGIDVTSLLRYSDILKLIYHLLLGLPASLSIMPGLVPNILRPIYVYRLFSFHVILLVFFRHIRCFQ